MPPPTSPSFQTYNVGELSVHSAPGQPSHLSKEHMEALLQSSVSEYSHPSAACVMGMGQTAPFLSPSCSRLSFPAPSLSASSSTFCCHTSGFKHGATSWIWSLAAVCCQCFPTENRDGIQKARGNGGQAGKVHSRWRLRQNWISTGAMSFSLFSTSSTSVWCFGMSFPLLYYFWKCRLPPPYPLPLNELFLDANFYSRLYHQHRSLEAHPSGHSRKGAQVKNDTPW